MTYQGESNKPSKGGQDPSESGEPAYEVGNKKPPKEFQFKPGQSGNPKGRPKGSTSLEDKVRNELSKLVTVNQNGKSRKMSKLDVGVRRLVDRFMAGDLKSTAIIIGLGKRNDTPKPGQETPDSFVMPDEANLEFIYERLKGLIKGGSGDPSNE
jgi:hypothetical protein